MTLYKCGWCGWPCSGEGSPLVMSQIGLKKDLGLWDNATLVNGECCAEQQHDIETRQHLMRMEEYYDRQM